MSKKATVETKPELTLEDQISDALKMLTDVFNMPNGQQVDAKTGEIRDTNRMGFSRRRILGSIAYAARSECFKYYDSEQFNKRRAEAYQRKVDESTGEFKQAAQYEVDNANDRVEEAQLQLAHWDALQEIAVKQHDDIALLEGTNLYQSMGDSRDAYDRAQARRRAQRSGNWERQVEQPRSKFAKN